MLTLKVGRTGALVFTQTRFECAVAHVSFQTRSEEMIFPSRFKRLHAFTRLELRARKPRLVVML